MSDISYKNWQVLSDEAIETDIGNYIRKERQAQRKTQKEVAASANISRSTLSLLERGESGSLKTLIQVLRVLGRLQALRTFHFEELISPLALAREQHKSIQRVRSKGKKKPRKKSDW